MAITRIRGGQIQDRTIDGIKVKQNALLDEHIASNAAISESKLNIDWAAHTEILENKKVLDYVQINEQAVGGLDRFDATTIIGAVAPTALSTDTVEGVIVDDPKNAVIVRDAVTGDPILGVNGGEVFGRMEYVASPDGGTTPAKFEIAFYELDNLDAEIAFTMPADQTAKFQYLRRFNLLTVDEMFAANEKFVDGAADTNARLDLQQLAKDLYGNSWSLDHDGATNLTRSLVDEILAQTSGVINTETRASAVIDEVVAARGTFASVDERLDTIETNIADVENEVSTARGGELTLDARLDKIETKNADQDTALADEVQARQDADTAIKNDLASTDATVAGDGKGAEMVGVRDVAGKFAATNVEGVLVEIESRIAEVESGSGASNQEIVDARTSTLTGTHVDIDTRIEAGETRFEAVKTEVETARGTEASLDARLDAIEAAATQEATDRADADQVIKDDLAAQTTGKGANLVGIEDAAGVFTATNVEGALGELEARVNTLEDGGGAEVTATHTRDAATANGYFGIATFTELEGRFIDIENITDAQLKAVNDDVAQEILDRQNADQAIKDDLASTVAGKGASTIGIEDVEGRFTATQVEAALAELYDKIGTDIAAGSSTTETANNLRTKELESVGVKFGGQVTAEATPSMNLNVASAIVYNTEGARFETAPSMVTIGAADATNPRIDVVYVDALGVVQVAQGVAGASPAVPTVPAGGVKIAEVNVPANATTITVAEIADKRVFVGTGAEVQAARGSMATVDARLSVSLNPDGTLKAGNQVHDHKKHIEQITVQTSVVNMPTAQTFQNDGTLNVYVNGILQANGVNFTEVYDVDGNGIAVDFGTDPVLIGDIVILTWVNNNLN